MTTAAPRYIVASNLRAEMARANKKKGELAALLGISPAAVTRRIQGELALDIDEITAIAEWLDISVAALLRQPEGSTTGQYLADNVELVAA